MDEKTKALVDQLQEHITSLNRQNQELQLSLIAGEGGTFMGKRVKYNVEWPDGVPRGFEDEESVKAWAKRKLNSMRGVGIGKNVSMKAQVKN